MVLGRVGRRIGIISSERIRVSGSKRFSTNNKPLIEPNKNGEETNMLTHHDSYRDLDKLDIMTATKILLTTSPKKKKFGIDFYLVQLFFICLPSFAAYLIALYARRDMKIMEAELEKRQIEKAKKIKEAEEEALKSSPPILEIKERLDSLEKTLYEIVTESKNKRSMKISELKEDDKKQYVSSLAVEHTLNKQGSVKQEKQLDENQKAIQGGSTDNKK